MDKKYLLATEDGTSTLFLEEYDQAMHSTSGAYEESLLKHIIPSRILDYNSGDLCVLDIGFGLGYNVLAVMDEFLKIKSNCMLNIISFEKDNNFYPFIDSIKFNDSRDTLYDFIKSVYLSGEGVFDGISLKILFGDARHTLRTVKRIKADAVFQDPFSPSKNPELWSRDFFLLLKEHLSDDGIITTYSSADHIRRGMYEAGLSVGRGPSVGKKREGTLAYLKRKIEELDDDEKKRIFSNIKSLPYEDPLLNLPREQILQNRLLKIREIKKSII